ncbi:hypothetical protein GCM10009853_072520 [Glycomyces scopariae]
MDVLTEMPEWQLSPERWERVAEIIEALVETLTDSDAFRANVVQLEIAGPVRTTRLGANPAEPAPPHIRDSMSHLMGLLGHDSPSENDHGTSRKSRFERDGDENRSV